MKKLIVKIQNYKLEKFFSGYLTEKEFDIWNHWRHIERGLIARPKVYRRNGNVTLSYTFHKDFRNN